MFGTVIFSYGLPGLAIVCALLAVVWRRNARDFIIYFLPVLLYSMVHQPMRQPMMWSLLILVCALRSRVGKQLLAPTQCCGRGASLRAMLGSR